MTPAPIPGRASALHRKALDGVAEAAADPAAGAPAVPSAGRPPAALPGVGVIAIALVGLALGLAATAIALGRGWDPGAVAVGPWLAQPRVGTAAIDPYALAGLARSGTVPLSASEGLTFTATTDDTGYRLLRTCSYRLSGPTPPARFWTLTATDAAGLTLDDPAGRVAFTSPAVLRDADGRFTIEIGPTARPGNWLPLSGEGPLTLTLRFYDTPLNGDPAEIAGAALPAIARQGCGGGR